MITVETTPNAVRWERIKEDAKLDRNSCSVHALAMLADLDYASAAGIYADLGRRFKRGSFWHQTREAYPRAHCVLTEISNRSEGIISCADSRRDLDMRRYRRHPVTINQACKALPLTGRFLIRSTSHVSAFIDGVHYCTAGMPRKRVKSIWLVTPQYHMMKFCDLPDSLKPPEPRTLGVVLSELAAANH